LKDVQQKSKKKNMYYFINFNILLYNLEDVQQKSKKKKKYYFINFNILLILKIIYFGVSVSIFAAQNVNLLISCRIINLK